MTFFRYHFLSLIIVHCVLAQFQLTFPAPRGSFVSNSLIPPCGGYDIVSQNRTRLPLETPFVEINSTNDSYSYKIHVIVSNNPTAAKYFETSPAYVSVANGTRNYAQASCLQLNLPQNITDGTNATIQVAYNNSNGMFFQCTDVTFLQNMDDFNRSLCFNANGTHPLIRPNDNASPGSMDHASDASDQFHFVSGLLLCIATLFSFLLI